METTPASLCSSTSRRRLKRGRSSASQRPARPINTTNSTRLGIQGNSFLLSLNGEVRILELLIFDAGFTVRRQRRMALRLQRRDRLLRHRHGQRSRLPRLEGQLRHHVARPVRDRHRRLRAVRTGHVPGVNVRLRSVRQPDLRLRAVDRRQPAGSPVRHHARRRRLQRHLHRSNRANTSGRVEIKLSVTVRIEILFVTVSKTATFSLGWLQLPPPVFLAGDADGPVAPSNPNWNPDWRRTATRTRTARSTSMSARVPASGTSRRTSPTRCTTSVTAASTTPDGS